MRRDRLLINKEMVPYSFDILLASELFHLTVNYNRKHDLFTMKLMKDTKTLCEAEPLIYGTPLFGDIYMAGNFPAVDIIPIDPSGEESKVTYETLGEVVFLELDNGKEEILSGGEVA